ncbi:hypothetical protein [Azospirillum sp.]|uniref:hypothetical protein n=1 Tax=Azospirillum sp. TaxID=34012 RepID=UPI003D7092B2
MTAHSALARAALTAALLLSAPAVAAAAESAPFVTGMGDVPAMPGLTSAESDALVFDKPGGRIVESVMQGAVERKAVLGFYAQTMPQLGWKPVGSSRFVRDGEELRLEFPGGGGRSGLTTVRFVLKPK